MLLNQINKFLHFQVLSQTLKLSTMQHSTFNINRQDRTPYIHNIWKRFCFPKKIFRTGLQKSLLKKCYELASGSQFLMINLDAVNRKFDWLEISLIFDKSIQHVSIFDRYNTELASKIIGKVKVESKISAIQTV